MTEQMTRQRVVDIITAARARGERPNLSGLDLSGLDLSGLDLSGADMSHTNLADTNLAGTNLTHAHMHGAYLADADMRGAYLRGAILTGANLHRADLTYAKLIDADMRSAILTGAILTGAILTGADLRGVAVTALFLDGLPSGNLAFIPTPEGWSLTIGCWTGTTDELRAIITGNEGWPEAEGEEIAVRRPMLTAAADICEAYANANPDALADVMAAADRWKENNN